MLRAEGLSKAFGALTATDDVSLALAPGERVGLIGPNGAGKTTLFNILAGEIAPDAGRVLLDGADVTALGPDARARRGLARSFQKNAVFDSISVADNLALADLAARGRAWRWRPGLPADTRDRVAATAERVGLTDQLETPADALSYGAVRQLEVGLALIAEPKALLLDEPTAGMSPEETAAMQALIADLPQETAVLLVEHDMDLVFGLAERLIVMTAGAILFDGAPEDAQRSEAVREVYLGAALEEEGSASASKTPAEEPSAC